MEYSVYRGKRTPSIYYITHSFSDDLTVRAYLASQNPCRPLRELVGSAVFSGAEDHQAVWSSGSHVREDCRRDGLLSAMYDHLEAQGYHVVPADGSSGNELQVQSQDGRAFWASRSPDQQVMIQSCSEREFSGWDNEFADADQALGQPVHQKLDLGERHPMLVLWGRHFPDSDQRVGVIYREDRGYCPIVLIGDPRDGQWEAPQNLRYRNGAVSGRMRNSTAEEMKRIAQEIERVRFS